MNDVLAAGGIQDVDKIALPDELDDVYSKFIQRELACHSSVITSEMRKPRPTSCARTRLGCLVI
jgi:hypothetical protein